MRLQKEEMVAVVLLLMALGSLAAAAWALGGLEKSATAKADSKVSVEGVVLELNPTKSGGNLILKLDSTPAAVFVPQDSGAQDVMDKVGIGDRICVKGSPTEYQGSEEIKVDRAMDIQVINAGEK
jgi:DNA/RNA endonuclease YhcR with UshA esterase domain